MTLSDRPPLGILVLALMLAAFGTLVEAQSWRGFDNLFMPLGLLVFLSVHLESSLSQLLGLLFLFLAAHVAFLVIGRHLGLSRHAARVHVVAMFLILAMTDVQNAILPGLVLLAHSWAGLRAPSRDGYGDLDIVAAIALLSFGWLAMGNASGVNAVAFYGLSAMGLALGLTTMAVGRNIAAVVAAGAFLLLLRAGAMAFNPAPSRWAEPLHLLAFLCLVLPAGAVVLAPGRFARDRVLKLTIIALIPPLTAYIWAVFMQQAPGQ